MSRRDNGNDGRTDVERPRDCEKTHQREPISSMVNPVFHLVDLTSMTSQIKQRAVPDLMKKTAVGVIRSVIRALPLPRVFLEIVR